MAHSFAKNSFLSRVTFGLLVPNYAAEVAKLFSQTHEATYTKIKNAITLVERMKTLLLVCQADADVLTHIIAMEILQLKDEYDAHDARGVFAQLHNMLSDALNSRSSALELETREEHLDDIKDVTKDALEDMEQLLIVLNDALAEMEEIRKSAAVPVIIGPQVSMEMRLALLKEMSTFEGQRVDLGAAYSIA